MPSETLHLCRTAFKNMVTPMLEGNSLVGRLRATEENCALFARLHEKDLVYPSRNFGAVNPEAEYQIEVTLPRTKEVFFALSLSDLLTSQASSHHTAPVELYFADTDEFCNSTTEPIAEQTRNYFQVLKAVSLLRKVADFDDMSSGTLKLVFLQREKLEVPVIYDVEALRPLVKIDEWFALISGDIHSEQRRTIFRTVLVEELRSLPLASRFKGFLQAFDTLFSRFRDNYQLYVAEFSFEKIMGEIAQKKLDYILKLNKTFSEIQNQLLAIPVAVVLVGGQMEEKGALTVKNLVVFCGVLVFAVLMTLLLRNQRDSLSAISGEIGELRNQFRSKSAIVANGFDQAYEDLYKRERRQRNLINAIDVLVALALAGTMYIFFSYSGITKQFGW